MVGATTLSIESLKVTFSITTLSIESLNVTFSIMALRKTTLCHYAKCLYAECRILFIGMVSAVMLNVVAPQGWSLSKYEKLKVSS